MPTVSGLLGRVLKGRYRLDAGLGSGGSAHVFLAFDVELARAVAVKLLHPGLAGDEAFLPRFRAEARAAAGLNHPNIVQIYDWGRDDGDPFLVLEYLPGGSLRDLLDRGTPLGPPEVARIGAEAARALAFAHHSGIVHRDIKPANLLFDGGGTVHVGDFGLARALGGAAWTEPAGYVLGTARYASPEQASRTEVNDRSDVYSLALVCYEALVGEPAFSGDTPAATLMARVGHPLPASTRLGRLAPILAGATVTDPRRRLDAAGFADALERLAADLPPARLALAPRPSTAGDGVEAPRGAVVPPSDTTEAILLGDEDPPGRPGPGAARRRSAGRRRRRWPVPALVVALALAGVGGAAAYVHFGVYGHAVPSLSGRPSAVAQRLARRVGLRIGHISRAYSAAVPSGAVVTQSLRPGSHVRAGTRIDLVVSRGHAPVAVPGVTGIAAATAQATLRRAHFVVHLEPAHDETVPAGSVISEAPANGAAPFGSAVVLHVSEGPAPRTIPTDLPGATVAHAAAELEGLRLEVREVLSYSNDVAAGDVVSSQPAPGASGIAVGTTVTVTVSRGPRLVAVPSVSGESISAAVSKIEAAGLRVSEQIGPPFATSASTTDPAPGALVAPGSSVTLYAA